MADDADLTGLLHRWRSGDGDAMDRLVDALYDRLRVMARGRLAGERADHTLDSRALVHEAFLRLVGLEGIEWRDRAHFLAMASIAMRRVLVDHARAHRTARRGGGLAKLTLEPDRLMSDDQADAMIELNDVLARLEAGHPRQAMAVELHYLGGLTQSEIADAAGVSQPTVARDLEFGRAWLARAWRGASGEGSTATGVARPGNGGRQRDR